MKNILITGQPGIGKTTLVKKIVNKLNQQQTNCGGFYTEEVRSNNRRIGFDIVTLDGQRAILARKGSNQDGNLPTVGQYAVYLDDFEKLALPVFNKPKDLLVIDEIGKMELFSKVFQDCIRNIMQDKDTKFIATVPLKGGPALVKQLKENRNCKLIIVNEANRDVLVDEVIDLIITK